MAKILIVDDRPLNRELLLTLLGYAGHDLLEASNGEEGFELARTEKPDLIIADIIMPALDGYEFARQVRSDPSIANTEIIFYTASYTEGTARQMAQACGVSYILTKPSEPQVILDTVKAALQEHAVKPMHVVADNFQREHLRLLTDELAKKVEDLEREVEERKRAEAALLAKDEELRATTQQLWQAAKLATMGKLAAEIAHELNNPLTGIRLRLELLMMNTPENDPRRHDLDVIDLASRQMSGLVSNLLQSSRRSQPEKAAIDIELEMVKSLELMEHHLISHHATVVTDFAPDLPPVLADRQQMRQVFLNLLTNACDAMPRGGTVTVRLYPDPVGADTSAVQQVAIEISDTGDGIPPEILSKVWESFFTTKAEGKGTGLGLAICRRIMEEHGGTINIQSDGIPGHGARVHLTLPIAGSN